MAASPLVALGPGAPARLDRRSGVRDDTSARAGRLREVAVGAGKKGPGKAPDQRFALSGEPTEGKM